MEIIEIATTFFGLRRFKDLKTGIEIYIQDNPMYWEEKIPDFIKNSFSEYYKYYGMD